jgi:apolipoprotein N-acyltransferase
LTGGAQTAPADAGTRRIPPALLAIASGLLLFLSFPKFGNGVFAWVALFPLLLAISRNPRAFQLGYLAGFVASLGIVYWTSLVVVEFGGLPMPVGIAVMVLLCLALALFPGSFAWAVGRWYRVLGPRALLLAPVAWVAMEWLRAHTLCDFAWCLLGYSQDRFPAAIQVARYGAVYAVSFVLVLVSSVLAYAVVEADRDQRLRVVAGAALFLIAVLGYGFWQLQQPIPESGRVRVGLVQADILQEEKWDPGKAYDNVQRHLALTKTAAEQGARLVVWPESSAPYYYDRNPAFAATMRARAADSNVYLLFGNDDRDETHVYVGAKMLTPQGALALRYHKIRLVPFGEYVPMQPLLTLGGRMTAKLVQQVADFTPGSEPVLGQVDGHAVGAFICYEAIFPDTVREFAAGGAELLINITNDAWYGRTSAPHQHMAMAAFRAVENGKYLVRAANTGITAVVDPYGRIVERTDLFVPAVLVRDVPFSSESTFYARHGDVFAWSCLGAAFALLGHGFLRGRARAA